MTKDDILYYAAPYPLTQSDGVALAYQHATAAVIQAKVAQVQAKSVQVAARIARWGKVVFLLLGLMVLSMCAMAFTHPAFVLIFFVGCMAFLAVATNTVPNLERKQRYLEAVLKELLPIAGTDVCREALQYLEKDAPGVVTWRDIALQERGQLYGFDVDIMRRLHKLEESRLQREAKPVEIHDRQRLNEEAYRKLHGLELLGSNAAQ